MGEPGWQRGSDAQVAQRLGQELARVSRAREPADVLGLAKNAAPAEVRAAFLAATKQFHPNLFARRPAEIAQQANELFLIINRAYTKLVAEPQYETARPGQAPISRRPKNNRMQSTYRTAIPVSPEGEVMSRSPSRKTGAPSGSDERGTGSVNFRVPKNRRTGGEASTRGAAPPSGAASTTGTRSGRTLAQRRAARRKTPMAGVPTVGRPPAANPMQQSGGLDPREAAFTAALATLQRGDFTAARHQFRELAVANPTEKRFRVYMHYAWGREYQATSEHDRAVAEYNRALKLDPSFTDAADAIAALQAASKRPRLLSKLFNRD